MSQLPTCFRNPKWCNKALTVRRKKTVTGWTSRSCQATPSQGQPRENANLQPRSGIQIHTKHIFPQKPRICEKDLGTLDLCYRENEMDQTLDDGFAFPVSVGAKILQQLLFNCPANLSNPGITCWSPALQANTLPAEPQGKSILGLTERKMRILPSMSGIQLHIQEISLQYSRNFQKDLGSLDFSCLENPLQQTFACWFNFLYACEGFPQGHTIRGFCY